MITIKLKNVTKELTRVKNEFEKRKSLILPSIGTKMARELASATPVKTGLARRSWTVVNTGSKIIPVKVINTVPYIEYLNAGSSKQAPAFFVDRIALKYGKPVGVVVNVVQSPNV
jgi:hypothetical protein